MQKNMQKKIQKVSGEQKIPILAILSLVFGFILPVVGIVLGIVALIQIKNDNQYKGKGFAIAGIVVGFAFMIVPIAFLAYFGVLDPAKMLPERAMFDMPLGVIENPVIDAEANQISIAMMNNEGFGIRLSEINSGEGDCGDVVSWYVEQDAAEYSETIPSNSIFILTIKCSDIKKGDFYEDFTVRMRNTESGAEREIAGNIRARVN